MSTLVLWFFCPIFFSTLTPCHKRPLRRPRSPAFRSRLGQGEKKRHIPHHQEHLSSVVGILSKLIWFQKALCSSSLIMTVYTSQVDLLKRIFSNFVINIPEIFFKVLKLLSINNHLKEKVNHVNRDSRFPRGLVLLV